MMLKLMLDDLHEVFAGLVQGNWGVKRPGSAEYHVQKR